MGANIMARRSVVVPPPDWPTHCGWTLSIAPSRLSRQMFDYLNGQLLVGSLGSNGFIWLFLKMVSVREVVISGTSAESAMSLRLMAASYC